MEKTIAELTQHPELLGEDTLYGLRELVAKYPYYQAARLLFLKNLFLLHDPSFGAELRRAAVLLPDRTLLFRMVEGGNYEIKHTPRRRQGEENPAPAGDRTQSLIDDFLSQTAQGDENSGRRHPTAADALTDYAAFLMQMEDAPAEPEQRPTATSERNTQLIEGFMANGSSRIRLAENPEYAPETDEADGTGENAAAQDGGEEGFLTMTLAKIYIKQQRYEKALEIMRKVSAANPKSQAYFADQVRFLRKLIVNSSHATRR